MPRHYGFRLPVVQRTRVAVIQNGVEHVARFEKHIDPARIVPVMIDMPADRLSPGRTIQRGPAHMVVPAGKNGADFLQLFAHTNFDAKPTDDFVSAVWRKLCLNSAGAISAVLLKPAGIVHHEGVAEAMRTIIRECIAVGRAEGAKLEDGIADDLIERAQARTARRRQLHAGRSPRRQTHGVRRAQWRDRETGSQAWNRRAHERADGVTARGRAAELREAGRDLSSSATQRRLRDPDPFLIGL